MGLTVASTGHGAMELETVVSRRTPSERVVALAGNPNVGKSTVFNHLTGMNQHTGNWPGKTVGSAQGRCQTKSTAYVFVDIPGTYSLMARSKEEEVARDFICFGQPDAVVVVCDATCLERNLNLVLQIIECGKRVLVCVNLLDEARRKRIAVDLEGLSQRLGVPVVGTTARDKRTLTTLLQRLDDCVRLPEPEAPFQVAYPPAIESAIAMVEPALRELCAGRVNSRWLALRLLEGDPMLLEQAERLLDCPLRTEDAVAQSVARAEVQLHRAGIDRETWQDRIAEGLVRTAEDICRETVKTCERSYHTADRKVDRILTSRWGGYPVMLLLLAAVFWLTITGANYPSQLLSTALFWVQDQFSLLLGLLHAPQWLHDLLVLGVFRVVAWVVSVMLPPMAIFFPLFTLLEDAGYLPRVAYNLDHAFRRCKACGKQALTMCMGLGCNAAGVVGCRIIDSPRERLIAILTNSLVPCNGRFPALIAIITMFFLGGAVGRGAGVLSALLLTAAILLAIVMTFFVSRVLSATLLRGMPSAFALELPPYRKPQIGKVIVRSVFDRTLFVLGRAVSVAAPAGLLIWCMANCTIAGQSPLQWCVGALDPFARLLGIDGVILMAFILGLPANEIVLPILLMAYLSQGTLQELGDLAATRQILAANGWTWLTAVNTMVLYLFHWPCATTLLTVHKETGSVKWTALAAAIPTVCGMLICLVLTAIVRAFT